MKLLAKNINLKVQNRLITLYVGNRCGWLRVFGKGLKWKYKTHSLLFSERNGHQKYILLFGYYISILKNNQ